MNNEINIKTKSQIDTKPLLGSETLNMSVKANEDCTLIKTIAILTSRNHKEADIKKATFEKLSKSDKFDKAKELHSLK
jgi:trehalose/maltose hydrolase-like predicted phosphorylase